MNPKSQSLNDLRGEMDRIDGELVRLLCERMETAAKIAEYKRGAGKPVYDPVREREKLNAVAALAGEEFGGAARRVWEVLMEVSKDWQNRLNRVPSPLYETIVRAASESAPFPVNARIACQGAEGAYSTAAAEKLFSHHPDVVYESSFGEVLDAVENGQVRYGILPAENTIAGPVNEVWRLLERRNVFIVRSVRVKAEHCLLVNPGTALSDVREVVSHEQALSQCGSFLDSLGEVKVTRAANTAVAARAVRDSGRSDLAAISSERCAVLYGLETAARSIQNAANNVTRFLCVSKEPEIDPDADRSTVVLVTPNEPGALYRVLSRFQAAGINLTALHAQPIEGRDFEFRFRLDFECPVRLPFFAELMQTVADECEEFRYLGAYSEII